MLSIAINGSLHFLSLLLFVVVDLEGFFKKIYLFIYLLLFFNNFYKVEFLSTNRGSLFSNLLLCRIIDIVCCIAIVLISVKVCLIASFGILNFSSKIFIEGM